MENDLSTQINRAIQLAQSGQTAEALSLLRSLLKQQPDHILGLMWLSGLTSDPNEGIAALEKVLSLNPEPQVAQAAQKGLSDLRAKVKAVAPAPSAPRSDSVLLQATSSQITQPPAAPDPIEQARAVIWTIRRFNRPLGELLDEGKVTQTDLQWAMNHPDRVSNEIRAAALVLFEASPKNTSQPAPASDSALADAVKEARKVIWPFRRMNRPMGQLLDEGKITEKDLRYAAHRANAAVRLAAQILLRNMSVTVRADDLVEGSLATDMSLAEANAAIWPFNKSRLNRPMGELLAQGKITIKDLRYAIDNSKAEEVVEAAQVLLNRQMTEAGIKAEATGKLEEPAEVKKPTIEPLADGSLIVLGSSDYMAQGKTSNRLKLLYKSIFGSSDDIKATVEEWSSFDKGQRGEDAVVKALGRLLDRRWKLYRNVILDDSDSDLDLVLVGPTGVLVLEVKAYRGSFKVQGSQWQYKLNGRWRKGNTNPTEQAQWNQRRLQRFLKDKYPDVDLPISVMIVLGIDPDELKLYRPAVVVTRVKKLASALEPYLAQALLAEKDLKVVMKALDKTIVR